MRTYRRSGDVIQYLISYLKHDHRKSSKTNSKAIGIHEQSS
jgi:hypothetical protein